MKFITVILVSAACTFAQGTYQTDSLAIRELLDINDMADVLFERDGAGPTLYDDCLEFLRAHNSTDTIMRRYMPTVGN